MKNVTLVIASLFFALFFMVACENAPKPEAETEEVTVIENVEVAVDTTSATADTVVVMETEEEIK